MSQHDETPAQAVLAAAAEMMQHLDPRLSWRNCVGWKKGDMPPRLLEAGHPTVPADHWARPE